MEVGSYPHESDDTSELFDDFAALPDQFRPKKSFRTEPKNPTLVPKITIPKENNSYSKVAHSNVGSSGKTLEKSPSISKSAIEKDGRNVIKGRSSTLSKHQIKQPHLRDKALDLETQSMRCVSKKDLAVKKNPIQKGLCLSKEFSKMSVETVDLPKDIKIKSTVWNNDLVFQTEPQVWKFNGTTLEPEKTGSRVTKPANRTTITEMKKETTIRESNACRKSMGSTKKNSAWNDNMDLFVEKNVKFGYISKETKNGSSTITACWGDVHQTRPLGPSKQNRKHANTTRSPKKTVQPKHEVDAKQRDVNSETEPTNQAVIDKPKRRRRSKNVKTTVIRHEIKIIHVNEKGEPQSEKEDCQNGLSLEKLVPSSCKDRLFAKGAKAGLEDSRLFHYELPIPKSKTKEHSLSDMEKISVCNDTSPKGYKEDFSSETTKGCCTALDDYKNQRNLSFLNFGRKISDIVAGSHVARSTFVALYEKWIPVRNKTIELIEKLSENVSCSRRRNKQIQKAEDLIQKGTNVVSAVPNIKVTIVARIIAVITPFISMLFKSSPTITQTGVTETEMMNQIQDDIEATLEVYMFGTQCDYQFREGCELFEEFQAFIDASDFDDFTGPEAEFVRDISYFNPKNLVVYYKRLNKAFVKLNDNRTSEISRTFCRGFEVNPQAIETIQHLYWRFSVQIEDSEAFQRAWQEVSRILDSSDSNTEVLEDIRNCVNILRKERRTIENKMAELRENIE